MAGIEVLGALASIGQLTEYGIKLINTISAICHRLEGAHERLRRYTPQLERLIEVAILIQRNKQLQISVIHAQVEATVVQAQNLLQIIQTATTDYTEGACSKRLWKAARHSKEKLISKGFENLEQEKCALILSISIVQADAYYTISSGIDRLLSTIPTFNEMSKDITSLANTGLTNVQGSSFSVLQKSELATADQTQQILENKWPRHVVKEEIGRCMEEPLSKHSLFVYIGEAVPSTSKHYAIDTSASRDKQEPSTNAYGNIYYNVNACEVAPQHNGDFRMAVSTSHKYENVSTIQIGRQMNGNYGASGKHSYCDMRCYGEGWQVNGNVGLGVNLDTEMKSLFS